MKMTIRTKLIASLLAAALLVAVVGGLGVDTLRWAQYMFGEFTDRNLTSVTAIEELRADGLTVLNAANSLALLYALDGTEATILDETEEFTSALTALEASYSTYEQLFLRYGGTQDVLYDLDTAVDLLILRSTRLVEFVQSDENPRQILAHQNYVELAENSFKSAIGVSLDSERAALELFAQKEVNDELANGARTTAIAAAIGIMLAVAGGSWIGRTIVKPIGQLETAASKMAAGDFDQRVTVSTKDEIGQLADQFNSMAGQLGVTIRQLEQRTAEAQAARERAERSDQVKSAFLASMSHELRTPLNAVINFSKFVVKGVMGPVNEKQEEALNKVIASGKHLLALINDVLDMSKIESGSLNLFIEDDVNLNDLAQTAVATAHGLIEDKPVTIRAEIAPDLPIITGDRQRILQILLNIIANACKFTHEGEIVISARMEGDQVRFSVRDTGPGIEAGDQRAVFEAFKQTQAGLRQGGGTGLGMPISRSLAEAHGGRLWFESAVGQGTTFHVTLPVRSSALVPIVV